MRRSIIICLLLALCLQASNALAAKLTLKKGSTSVLIEVFVQDTTSTTGGGLTGLAYNSAGLTAYYYRSGAASATAVSLATMTVGTWGSGGFAAVDGTNMPGVYQLGLPDAALAAGAGKVIIMLKGASNMAPLPVEIELVDYVEADTYARIGAPAGASIAADVATRAPASTALSNATWTDTRAGKLDNLDAAVTTRQPSGNVTVGGYAAGQAPADSILATPANKLATDATGRVTVGSNADKTGYSLTQTFPANFSSLSITAGGAVTAGTVNDKTGYALTAAYDPAKSAASQSSVDTVAGYVDTEVSAVKAVTDKLDTALELDISVYRFTANALEMGPSGGGGVADWTPSERDQIRQALGVTGTKAATSGGNLDAVKSKTDGLNFTGADVKATLDGETVTVGGYAAGQSPADSVLSTPANKLTTDATGRVTVGSNADKTGYSLTQSFPTNFASLLITAGGAVTVGTNNDKSGYSLTQSFPTNFSSLLITAGGAVTAGTVNDKTGYSIAGTKTTLDALNDVSAASTWSYVTRTLTSGGGGATAAEIWSYATRKLTSALTDEGTPRDMAGTGAADPAAIWTYSNRTLTASPITLPVFQGYVYTATAQQQREVAIVRKSSPRVPMQLNQDFTGWTITFAAKAKYGDTEPYAIAPTPGVWTNAATGEGYVDLTSLQTTLAAGKYFGELLLTNGEQRLPAIKFTINIVPNVVN